jgi:hypothetical protein
MPNEPLDHDVRAMIDAYRNQRRPSATDVNAVWRQVQRALGFPALMAARPLGQAPAPASHSAVALAPKVGAMGKLWFIAGVGLGLTGGAVGFWRVEAAKPSVPSASASSVAVTMLAPPSASSDETVRPDPVQERAADSTPVSPTIRSPAPPVDGEAAMRRLELQLTEERRRLDEARAALTRRNAATALLAIDDHQRKYPSGLLSEERESLRVQALVMAHEKGRARAAADAFARRFPNSMYWGAVERAVHSLE